MYRKCRFLFATLFFFLLFASLSIASFAQNSQVDHLLKEMNWMPFAGLKESGLGTGGIPYTMRDMQIEKLMVLRSPAL